MFGLKHFKILNVIKKPFGHIKGLNTKLITLRYVYSGGNWKIGIMTANVTLQ
jgi:hypothetical protein